MMEEHVEGSGYLLKEELLWQWAPHIGSVQGNLDRPFSINDTKLSGEGVSGDPGRAYRVGKKKNKTPLETLQKWLQRKPQAST